MSEIEVLSLRESREIKNKSRIQDSRKLKRMLYN